MAEESQNALLKTLEEPAPFAHILLVSSQPSALLETVRSRCQTIGFAALSPEAIAERLAAENPGAAADELKGAARLAGGDVELARILLSDTGRELADAGRGARARRPRGRAGRRALEGAPGSGRATRGGGGRRGEVALRRACGAGQGRVGQARRAADSPRRRRRSEAGDSQGAHRGDRRRIGPGRKLASRRGGDGRRRARPGALNADRGAELAEDAEGLDPRRARRAAELVMGTRRRLSVNVSEELAVEALAFRMEAVLQG